MSASSPYASVTKVSGETECDPFCVYVLWFVVSFHHHCHYSLFYSCVGELRCGINLNT